MAKDVNFDFTIEELDKMMVEELGKQDTAQPNLAQQAKPALVERLKAGAKLPGAKAKP